MVAHLRPTRESLHRMVDRPGRMPASRALTVEPSSRMVAEGSMSTMGVSLRRRGAFLARARVPTPRARTGFAQMLWSPAVALSAPGILQLARVRAREQPC